MAAPTTADDSSLAAPTPDSQDDPFNAGTMSHGSLQQRFSNFEPQLFALGPNASPAQARRALEASLAETDRRMEEAGRLGTALVQQRKEIEERLRDVEKLKAEGELSEDLREKLVEIEKDYNEVAKESARAFLPKPRVPSSEPTAAAVPEGRVAKRSVSPSKFETQATGSPTKFSVPNRKVRNQPTNRVHDIEFAAEISTSLIAQVRSLQALLAEKDEELRDIRTEKSRLEYEAEGFQQRLKALDESENRYKEENWNLETQIHEYMAKEKEASDREKKLNHTLNVMQAEKNAAQRELDEVKVNHARLTDQHTAAVKSHDIELGMVKRNMIIADAERTALTRKVEELTGQNTELAKAVSASIRGRNLERESILGMSDEDFQTAHDQTTPEHSPPISPMKITPRHAMLETETLKTSLAHAQRTIQGLRNNVHREKTEKMETRRLLQEARDELEKLRSDQIATGTTKRARKTESKEFKKPPRLLGALRTSRSEVSEVFPEEPDWEDQPEAMMHPSPASRPTARFAPISDQSDHFETANETSDAAFETANERGTETDDFHTGAEEFSSDDVETETETPSKNRTLRGKPPSLAPSLGRSGSLHSTASTDDEADYPFEERRGSIGLPPLQSKFPLRVGRGAYRRSRSRHASEEPNLQSSPGSILSSHAGTPHQMQNLAAELGDFAGSDVESNVSGTPSRRSIRGRALSPPPPMPRMPNVIMVDSGTMTDSRLDVRPASSASFMRPGSSSGSAVPPSVIGPERRMSMSTVISRSSGPDYRDTGIQDVHPLELAVSTIHSDVVDPLPEIDFHAIHASEMSALRAEHAQQLKEMSIENTTAQAAALESLRSQHADGLAQAQAEARLVHAQELEAIRSSHADALSKATSEAQAAHAQEVEALKRSHADQSSKAADEAKVAHAQELESLKSSHATALSQALAEASNAHSQEIEALKASHVDQTSKAIEEARTSHARDVETLKASHAEQAEKSAAEAQANHSRELEQLRKTHAEQLAQRESDSKAAFAADMDALKALHTEQMSQNEAASKAAYAAEVENLKAKHSEELSQLKKQSDTAHATEIAALTASHDSQLSSSRAELLEIHTQEMDDMRAQHNAQIRQTQQEFEASRARELEALQSSHSKQIEEVKSGVSTAHSQEIESLKAAHAKQLEESLKEKDTAHAAAVAALVASHNSQLESQKSNGDATLSRELSALREAHSKDIDTLNAEHAAAHAQELDGFKTALAKQVESSKSEGDAAHNQQIEALNAAHAEIIEAHKRDSESSRTQALESLKQAHDREIENVQREHASTQAKELEELSAKHSKELDALKADNESSKARALADLREAHSRELDDIAARHREEVDALRAENESSKVQILADLASTHSRELEQLRLEHESSRAKELEALEASHAKELETRKTQHEAQIEQRVQELKQAHSRDIEALRQEAEASKAKELAALSASHALALDTLKGEDESTRARKIQELADAHKQELESLRKESEAAKSKELAALRASHETELEDHKKQYEATHGRNVEELKATHAAALASLRTEHENALANALDSLKTEHAGALEALKRERDISQAEALDALGANHSKQLEQLKKDNDSALAKELEALETRHAEQLESLKQESVSEKDQLRANHASELDALKRALTVTPPTLTFSSLKSVATEPVATPESRYSRSVGIGELGNRSRGTDALVIAEDETRQSPGAARASELPESARPFKEMSTNTDARPDRKRIIDEGTQTGLTSGVIDRLMKDQMVFDDSPHHKSTAAGHLRRPSRESTGSFGRTSQRMTDSPVSAPMPIPARRPGSSASSRLSGREDAPPLPSNHRQAIEAARTGSSHSTRGTMGPPPVPASALRNSVGQDTPTNRPPRSPVTGTKGTPTPRAGRFSGYADVHSLSPSRIGGRSRQSSISSFASELDSRFHLHAGMDPQAPGHGHIKDPRMLNAVTQAMIGEYLWKYTRKMGRRGEISENRHRRYFWIHPYTRTLYWGVGDPTNAQGSELKAKSIPIEAVRVVADENTNPPGLHLKSIVVIASGRTLKFTCPTGQRHETWYNALSYVLLRTSDQKDADTEEMVSNYTQEDVDEFNPSTDRKLASRNTSRAAPSLSSYNSRTTRNESPYVEMMAIPTLTPTHEKEAARNGTLGKLSEYWRSSTISGTFSRNKTPNHNPHASGIYDASEVHDSAEDLRQMYEQQDRDADQLENVRACCDGKHDVGTLSRKPRRDRLSHLNPHAHGHPGSSTPEPQGSVRSQN
ncbi:hypothetical protein F4780DRAFT_395655 [Xylariomycetidae sp. FL0641]|nr:hypothetical protein F4780DRAFT_395655 [Xylariomycetidae sp. FL0641]